MKVSDKKIQNQISAMHFYEAMHVPELFEPFLKPSPKTWEGWGVVDAAVEGNADFILADSKRLNLFRRCTKLENPPNKPVREFYCVSGRRSGKSFYAACKAINLGLFHDWTPYLSAGEVGVIQIVSSDRAQSQVIFRYISGILNGNPYFKQYIQNEFKESMELSNRVVIEVMSCSYRSIRGRSVLASLLDEACFFMSEGRRTDRELVQAIRPSMMTIPNSKLIVISSAYAKTGVVYEMWKDYFGKANDSVLVWQSDSLTMNPTLDKGLIDIELKKDPSAARSEFFSEWRADISSAYDPDIIKVCAVLPGEMGERPFQVYSAFVDPSGGMHDAMTLAIGHHDYERKKILVDLLRAWESPFDPHKVTQEISEICKRYRVHRITGDRYAGEWVSEAFAKHGITYQKSELSKSKLYLELEAGLNTR